MTWQWHKYYKLADFRGTCISNWPNANAPYNNN